MPHPSADWEEYRIPRGKASSIARALETIDFEALCHIASALNPSGDGCHVDKGCYAFGGVNIVFEVQFRSGEVWIARLRFPDDHNDCQDENGQENPTLNPGLDGSAGVTEDSFLMREVTAMRFLCDNTTIPLPSVYGHDACYDNPVGLPYILMQAMPGKRLWGGGRKDFIPDQHKDKVYRQITDIMIQLYQHPFDRIGMLYERNGDVEIGPIVDVASRFPAYGPFSTAAEFYRHRVILLNQHRQNKLKSTLEAVNEHVVAYKNEPDATALIVDMEYNSGPFRLAHPDFTVNNFLFDDEYNITALLDWSGCQTVPMESFARIAERIIPDADQFLDGYNWPEELRVKWKSYRTRFIDIFKQLELERVGTTHISNMMESPRSHFAMCLDMDGMLGLQCSLPRKQFEEFRSSYCRTTKVDSEGGQGSSNHD